MEAVVSKSPSVCGDCRGKGYCLSSHADRALARVCSCMAACAHCGGQGYVLSVQEETFSQKVGPRRYEAVAPCICRVLRSRVERFNQAGIPGVLARAGFDNYLPFHEAHDAAKQAATRFAFGFRRGAAGRGFIISGPVGSGKTHLLTAALAHLVLEVGVQARYLEISLLFADIRRGFQEGKSGGEIIGPLSEVDVLAIDELGRGRGSPFEMETLDELIARRYNAGRTTLFATNYSLSPERKARPHVRSGYRSTTEEAAQPRDTELLRDRVGERIYSRLCEMCEFVSLPPETPDHRRTRQELHPRSNKPRALGH
ncbi:MAG: ATP-binding protein [Myxococcaceae bacterium]